MKPTAFNSLLLNGIPVTASGTNLLVNGAPVSGGGGVANPNISGTNLLNNSSGIVLDWQNRTLKGGNWTTTGTPISSSDLANKSFVDSSGALLNDNINILSGDVNNSITNLVANIVFVEDRIDSLSGTLTGFIATGTSAPANTSPYNLIYSTGLKPNYYSGNFAQCVMTGNATLFGPTGTFANGYKWEGWFYASGSSRNLTFDPASIKIPSLSSISGAQVLTSNDLYISLLKYNAIKTGWMLVSFVGGY